MASSGNFCTLNPLAKSANATVTKGNLYLPSIGYPSNVLGTMAVSSGKWYFEARCENNYGAYDSFGVIVSDDYTYVGEVTSSITGSINWTQLSEVRINGTNLGVTNTQYYNGDTKIVGCALDLDNNKVWFHGNGTYVYDNDESSANPNNNTGGYAIPSALQGKHFLPLMGTNAVGAPALRRANFGQDSSFGGDETAQGNTDGNGFGDFYYAPPTGFLALCTANLPISDDIDPAQTDDDYPSKQFNAIAYTGNSPTGQAITGLGFKPDLVWAKMRNSTQSNFLSDTTRGINKFLFSDLTNAEGTGGGYDTVYSSFDNDGFTFGGSGSGPNDNSRTYVAWCWRANGGTTASNSEGSTTCTIQANTAAGFSILSYTGTGSAATLGHGLTKAPEFILVKRRSSAAQSWKVYHVSVGATKYLTLNDNSSQGTSSGMFNNTTPTSTLISIGNESNVSTSSQTYIMYAWHSVEGYSKFGTYEGNGSADGPFLYLGFRPRMVCIKSIDSSQAWIVCDTARETFNPLGEKVVQWNTNDAEYDPSGFNFDALSSGFKIKSSDTNINATQTYIFMAWGDVPFKYNNSF